MIRHHAISGAEKSLTRRNVQHCTYREIADALAISVGTVKSRIARARGQLRTLMTQACPEFPADAAPREWFDPVRPSGRLESLCA